MTTEELTKEGKDKFLSYKEALSVIENFMIETDLRRFCEEMCGGTCCRGCRPETNPDTCKTKGRRLECSAYICNVLYNLVIPSDFGEKWENMDVKIKCCYGDNRDGGNPYFSSRKPETIKKFRIERKYFDFIEDKHFQNTITRKISLLQDLIYDCGHNLLKNGKLK